MRGPRWLLRRVMGRIRFKKWARRALPEGGHDEDLQRQLERSSHRETWQPSRADARREKLGIPPPPHHPPSDALEVARRAAEVVAEKDVKIAELGRVIDARVQDLAESGRLLKITEDSREVYIDELCKVDNALKDALALISQTPADHDHRITMVRALGNEIAKLRKQLGRWRAKARKK